MALTSPFNSIKDYQGLIERGNTHSNTHFQFHQGLSLTLGLLALKVLIAFQFHQGLSLSF